MEVEPDGPQHAAGDDERSRLNDLGVRVLYTEEDFDNTAAGRFALRSMMNVNQFYSENMAEDIRRGLRDNAMQCKVTNGTLPLGYKKDENLHYVLDPPNDEIVREIFGRVACGEPFVSIAEDLNARGVKTSRGGRWGRSSFHALLSNERYTGVYIYGDVARRRRHPADCGQGAFLSGTGGAGKRKIIRNKADRVAGAIIY